MLRNYKTLNIQELKLQFCYANYKIFKQKELCRRPTKKNIPVSKTNIFEMVKDIEFSDQNRYGNSYLTKEKFR